MTLREALSRLADEGRLTPRDVVEEARANPHSPLYGHIFALDDDEAAERYRLDRARALIRTFRVSYTTATGEKRDVRQFVSVATQQGRRYQHTEEVLANPLTAQLLLQGLERDMNGIMRKYRNMQGFREVVMRILDDAS